MTESKYRFFREQEESTNFRVDEINGDTFYVPNNIEKLNPTFIELSEYDDSELTYKNSSESSVMFSSSRLDQAQFFIDHRVQVRMTPTMGLGCFAVEKIPEKVLIESSPVILVHRDTFMNLNLFNGGMHKLSEYPFSWGVDGMCAVSMGYGSLYNHKPFPNVAWRPNREMQSMQYVTRRDIEAGEELFIRYLPLDRMDSLWFHDEESERYVNDNRNQFEKTSENFFNLRFK